MSSVGSRSPAEAVEAEYQSVGPESTADVAESNVDDLFAEDQQVDTEEPGEAAEPEYQSSGSEPAADVTESNVDDLFPEDQQVDTEEPGEDTEEPREDAEPTGLAAMPKIPKRNPTTSTENTTDTGIDRYPRSPLVDEPEEEGEEEAEPVDPQQAEVDEINKQIDAALRSGRARRRKRTDEDDASVDEAIVELRKRMRDAAYRDIDDNKDRLPAVHKLSMLPDVVEELSKTHLNEAFLDNNIVDSIRLWLEPLDDGSLPSLDIQNAMLSILKRLPIRRDHLRESGIGKIILFMSKCARISETNRRVCEQFIQQWSRMVLRLSSDYRDRKMREAAVSANRGSYASARPAAAGITSTPGTIRVSTARDKKNERLTAQIPRRVATDYSVMPVSSISPSQGSGARDTSDKYKRLRQAMAKGKRR
ncbi:Transcription factor iws1 [Coemansia sp. RSA 720]|nr:Transcription factor iws1 [Coemansia sp. RSA 720]